jgi:hypothetical protein
MLLVLCSLRVGVLADICCSAVFGYVLQVPISATRAINRFCLIRNFAINPAFDFMARE